MPFLAVGMRFARTRRTPLRRASSSTVRSSSLSILRPNALQLHQERVDLPFVAGVAPRPEGPREAVPPFPEPTGDLEPWRRMPGSFAGMRHIHVSIHIPYIMA